MRHTGMTLLRERVIPPAYVTFSRVSAARAPFGLKTLKHKNYTDKLAQQHPNYISTGVSLQLA